MDHEEAPAPGAMGSGPNKHGPMASGVTSRSVTGLSVTGRCVAAGWTVMLARTAGAMLTGMGGNPADMVPRGSVGRDHTVREMLTLLREGLAGTGPRVTDVNRVTAPRVTGLSRVTAPRVTGLSRGTRLRVTGQVTGLGVMGLSRGTPPRVTGLGGIGPAMGPRVTGRMADMGPRGDGTSPMLGRGGRAQVLLASGQVSGSGRVGRLASPGRQVPVAHQG